MENTMDKIYQDFTTKLLPQVAKGLVITKDYFTDLFGRYVKYLIVTDAVMCGILLLVIIVVLYLFWRNRRVIIVYTQGGAFIFLALLIIPITALFSYADDLAKDLYVPEIRVYQELSPLISHSPTR